MSRKEHRVALAREATSALDDLNSITRLNYLGCLTLVGTAMTAAEIFVAHGFTWRAVTVAASAGAVALLRGSYQKEKDRNLEIYHGL